MSDQAVVALAYAIGTAVICAALVRDGLAIRREYPSRRTLTKRRRSANADTRTRANHPARNEGEL